MFSSRLVPIALLAVSACGFSACGSNYAPSTGSVADGGGEQRDAGASGSNLDGATTDVGIDGGSDSGATVDGGAKPIGNRILSYLGGSRSFSVDDQARDVAVDAAGNMYITGGLFAYDGTLFGGAPNRRSVGARAGEDVFVVKLTPNGEVVYATIIGGPGYDRPYAIEVDAMGRAYVAGRAGNGFPTTAGVVQAAFGGDNNPNGAYGTQDGFVARLAADGSVDWATYIGDAGPAFIRDLAIDAAGNSYLGVTLVQDVFPHVTAGSFRATGSANSHAALVKLSSDGKQVVWGGHFATGASTQTSGGTPSVRVGPGGDVFVAYTTQDDGDPVTAGAAQAANAGGADLFVARVRADGGALVYGTYVGGPGEELGETHYLAVDRVGRAFVMGVTTSATLPAGSPPGALKGTNPGGRRDVLLARLAENGQTIQAATFIGGSGDDHAEGIDLDPVTGNVVVVGSTQSSDFVQTKSVLASGTLGDATIVALDPSLDAASRRFSTRLGGSGNEDTFRGVAVDHTGAIVAVGLTNSQDLVVENGIQSTYGGGPHDAFWVRLPSYPRAP